MRCVTEAIPAMVIACLLGYMLALGATDDRPIHHQIEEHIRAL